MIAGKDYIMRKFNSRPKVKLIAFNLVLMINIFTNLCSQKITIDVDESSHKQILLGFLLRIFDYRVTMAGLKGFLFRSLSLNLNQVSK